MAGNQSISSGTDTVIQFVDDFDPNNWWDASTDRFTPTIAGYYNITLNVQWPLGAGPFEYQSQIRKNGTTVANFLNEATTIDELTQGNSKLVYLDGSTDYVDFIVRQNSGSPYNILQGNSSGSGTYFSAALMTTGVGATGPTGVTGVTGATGPTGPDFAGYDRVIYVSATDGSDSTGNGDLTKPVASITYGLTLVTASRNTLMVYPGVYVENPTLPSFNGITISAVNIENIANSATYIQGTLTIGTVATNAMLNGLIINTLDITGTATAFINDCNIQLAINKSSTGAAFFKDSRNANSCTISVTGTGQTRFDGGLGIGIPTINAAGSVVTFRNVANIGTVTNTSGNTFIVDSSVFSTATYPVTSAAGTITMFNSQVFNIFGTLLEPIQVTGGNYSIINSPIDYAGSDLAGGTNNNTPSTFGPVQSTGTVSADLGTTGGGILINKGLNRNLANIGIGNSNTLGSTTTGTQNTAIGANALQSLTTASNNTAIGINALQDTTTGGGDNTAIGPFALSNNTTGSGNTAISNALQNNTTGDYNIAIGAQALDTNTTGQQNVGIGYRALRNSTASDQIAIGAYSLTSSTTGQGNIAIGSNALFNNTTGDGNTAIGYEALLDNTTGDNNTALGYRALENNTASSLTAVGYQALAANTTGQNNTALGLSALQSNTTGQNNIAVGANALEDNTTGQGNTAIGNQGLTSNTTGNNNIAIGVNVLTANITGSNNSALGTNVMDAFTGADTNIGFGSNIMRDTGAGSGNVAIGNNILQALTNGNANTGIGTDVLSSLTTGSQNNGIGVNAQFNATTGGLNNAMGTNALYSNQTGVNNVAIGNFAAVNAHNVIGTTAIGGSALIGTTAGVQNSALSSQSLRESTSIIATFGAITAGSGYTDGTYSGVELEVNYFRPATSLVGGFIPTADITVSGGLVTVVTLVNPGKGIRTGTICTILAASAPAGLLTGSGFSIPVATLISAERNTAIGFDAGRLNTTGSRNVFLGYAAGRSELTDDNLYISNSNTTTPLIKGKFDSAGGNAGSVRIYGDLQLTTKTPASAADTGTVGTITYDTDYIYICVATDTWKRVGIATW